jgi:hypothetical protein
VLLTDGFDEASAALQRARVTVLALNVTRADHNSLQAGLESVAEETGGAYVSTFRFTEMAFEPNLAGAGRPLRPVGRAA